ncbi:hypothetical protein C0995_011107, partial [Termitomyces sp. Mi166
MTDLDDCCANRNHRANTVVVPPLHFGSGDMRPGGYNQTAASSSERPIRQPAATADPFSMVIPKTLLPEGWDALLQNPMPRMVPPIPAPVHRRNNNMLRPLNQPVVAIPETHVLLQNPMLRMVPSIPAPAPLQNPMPRMMPPPPAPVHRRDNMLRPVNQPI